MGESANKIIERIERGLGIPDLASRLGNLAPSDLSSLLLEVYRAQVHRRTPAQVLADYEQNRFVRPARVSPQALLDWEQIAYQNLPPEFETLELSPLCPLGTSGAVAAVDQNWAVSTSRNTEVVSDATNVLALESALRRREQLRNNPKSAEVVRLAAQHRLVRPQFYDSPNLRAHFSLFSLTSAGRDQGSFRFEVSEIAKHIGFYLRTLRVFVARDIAFQVKLSDFSPQPRQSQVASELLSLVQSEFPEVECKIDEERQSGRGYYLGFCFHIDAREVSGGWLELVDGGEVDWTRRLLNNAKERLFISAIAGERVLGLRV